MANALTTVDFHGQPLLVTLIGGKPAVALRSVCDALGLDWQAQLQRIKRHPVLAEGVVITTTPSPGGPQQATCLPLDKLNGWLFGISASRAKPELRERLIQYQRECFDVLARHFGAAHPIPYSVAPSQTLSAEQAQTLRDMLQNAAQRLPKEKQGAFMVQGWSKLKAHFRVDYRHIPAAQFADAACLLARHISEAPALPAPSMDEAARQLLEHLKRWEAMRPARLADLVRDPGYEVSPRELREIADTCFGRVEALLDTAQRRAGLLA